MSSAISNSTVSARWRRARELFYRTRADYGGLVALRLFARLALGKVGRVRGSRVAMKEVEAVRAKVAQVRDASPSRPFIAFVVTGGLGDMLVIARFIRDFIAEIGDVRFDIFSPTPKPAKWAFETLAGFEGSYHDVAFYHLMKEYDVAFRVNQTVIVYHDHIRWDVIGRNQALSSAVAAMDRFRNKIDVLIDRHPWMDHFLAQVAVFQGATRTDFLHVMANLNYRSHILPLGSNQAVLNRFGLVGRDYVTVHNGFDPGFIISTRRATKCYPHFGALVRHLRQAMPDTLFVQIGTKTSEPIEECDLILVNQTTLDEVSGLVSHAKLHLDNEGGLVHLAACLGTRSAVIFGPTPVDFFGYEENINIAPPVCGACWWMTRTWMDSCAKGYAAPRCMTEQDPVTASKTILSALSLRQNRIENEIDRTESPSGTVLKLSSALPKPFRLQV